MLVQQYLAGLSPNSSQKTAAEVLGEYLIFLEEVHAMAEHSIFGRHDVSLVHEYAVGFIIETATARKQSALACLKRFWEFAARCQGWQESPLAGLPENIARTESERHYTILYLIQECAKTPAELSKQLLYEEATITDDIFNIRDKKGLGAFIWEFDKTEAQPKYQFVLHPFLLAFNLTQISKLLIEIRQLIQAGAPLSPSFSRLYDNVWFRLTTFGKERLLSLGLPAPDSPPPVSFTGWSDIL